jgi:hypothetical protein
MVKSVGGIRDDFLSRRDAESRRLRYGIFYFHTHIQQFRLRQRVGFHLVYFSLQICIISRLAELKIRPHP